MPCIYGFSLFTKKQKVFFLISQLWAKFECNVSYTRSHYLIFNIKPILPRAVFSLQYLQHSAQSIFVYYKYPPLFFLQYDILEIDACGWLKVMKQIKQAQPVLNMGKFGAVSIFKIT